MKEVHLSGPACFICGSRDSVPAFRPDVRRWGYGGEFLLRRCSGCGLVFNAPRLPPDELNRLYGPNYYFFHRSAHREMARIQQAYLRTMAHLPVARGSLLEVGSAKGYLLALLQDLGWDVSGVELAESAAAYSRQQFGLEIFSGTLEEFRDRDARKFDVVLALDVIEHVPDQPSFWQALHDLTHPGSWLIIDTPNVGGRNVPIVGDRWRGFNPFHIYLFDAETLQRSVTQAGFQVRVLGSYNEVPAEQSLSAEPESPGGSGGSLMKARLRSRVQPITEALDRVLLPHLLRRSSRELVGREPTPLDPRCGGDNLVCIAVHSD
ncbi:MAG TPA: class I SAM-dependent methyltransferase [Gemmatimonadales bacterium]|jgi:2-polyprenyl-3-methyl-5-hydroxy-6-metoxy-1,4-benzoquinol methylase|nr:class I SAM-dependent methyltransferase [Gemmatimonadales bacterium]